MPIQLLHRFGIWIIFFALCLPLRAQEDVLNHIDSLQDLIRAETNDKQKVPLLNQLAFEYSGIDPKRARLYAVQAYGIASSLNLREDLAETLRIFGFLKYIQSDYDKALEYLLNALKLFKKFDNREGIAYTKQNIGLIYQRQGSSTNALHQFQKSFKIFEELNHLKGEAICLYHIAQVESEESPQQALKDYQHALQIYEKINEQRQKAVVLNGIGKILKQQEKYEEALGQCLKAAQINKSIGEKKGIAESYIAAGELFLLQERNEEAVNYLLRGLNISKSIGAKSLEIAAYKQLSAYYESQNNLRLALRYYKHHTELKEEVFTKQKSGQIAEMKARYDSEQQEQENALLKAERELDKRTIERQNTVTIAALVITLLFLFVAILLYRKRKQDRTTNTILTDRNREISRQKEEVSKKNEELENQRRELKEKQNLLHLQNTKITDSIRYAQTIQQAILPTHTQLSELFRDFFVINKPRDIVSGDFYWVEQVDKYLFFAVVDCTGHGIPGSFMSLIGYSSLNEIVFKTNNPAKILEQLHYSIQKALKQGESSDNTDGMDVSLCRLEKLSESENKVLFCGAKQPLYHIHPNDRKLTEVRGNRVSIGGKMRKQKPFLNTELELPKGDILILASDGYADQNNPHRDKFGSPRLKRILAMNSYLPLNEQKHFLESLLKAHIENQEQRDDITILGVKL